MPTTPKEEKKESVTQPQSEVRTVYVDWDFGTDARYTAQSLDGKIIVRGNDNHPISLVMKIAETDEAQSGPGLIVNFNIVEEEKTTDAAGKSKTTQKPTNVQLVIFDKRRTASVDKRACVPMVTVKEEDTQSNVEEKILSCLFGYKGLYSFIDLAPTAGIHEEDYKTERGSIFSSLFNLFSKRRKALPERNANPDQLGKFSKK